MTVDYIIVGQGIAGTLLAYFLRQRGKTVLVMDSNEPNASSKIAAGIINPITGRKYVKSWRIDTLLPVAVETYRELENLLRMELFLQRPIIRTLFNHGEENDWLARTGDAAYQPYMADRANIGLYAETTHPAHAYGEVLHGGQVRMGALIAAFREMLIEEHAYWEETFDFALLEWPESGAVVYQNIQAQQIVFCEGYRGKDNPFFQYLPFRGAKGEVLIVKIPGIQYEKILKHQVFIVPLAQPEQYWIGSTYQPELDATPNPATRHWLESRLKEVLKVPFEVLTHQAAIRPTVKDRRPFLGIHPQFPQLAIFNGLGTKGASLGPYWAKHMADFLSGELILDSEVAIDRFAKI
ncbi:MAG TPA: FAD-binding oxidoreductase [Saprospiraceae bacterium]|nr:FAD-binding oxidoreductase [Saprospiraceae bacterium]HMQ84229.1 FAD-binding oxidoreductase [Saprospiraceae bacterium]